LKHILIVDDESVNLELFRSLFSDEAYKMTFVETGQEAIRVLQSTPVDLVITDKNLPDITGLDVLRAAKEVNKLTEVIIITGYASLETVLAAIELDAFDYMLKPLRNIFDIKNKVRQALEKQEMVLENARLIESLREHALQLEKALEERKRVESELIQSEKLAGIGTLASGIAHEISSPLFGILGLAEAILDEDDLELVRNYARDIVDYSKQIRDIVQELSAYSRTAKSDGVVPVDLKRVTGDALRLVQRSKKAEQLELRAEVEDALIVMARPNEIQQMLVNLVKNAVEALEQVSPDNPRHVTVRAWREPSHIVIQVADNGTGIPAHFVEKVFDPFFTTKEVGKGTGLGLHIVYRIVTKYEGTISVDSAEGVGTTFTIRFPSREA
jgi:C4-dicarboxylate-specific signal transduction histidine kinase